MLIGTVYLVHFDRPYRGPMQHYVGFTRHLPQRLQAHREGDGGVTTRRAFDQGIGFTLARIWWPGTLRLERQIKARGPVKALDWPLAVNFAASCRMPGVGAGSRAGRARWA
jgi:predicted GIY-YIG superfamily endonuclease